MAELWFNSCYTSIMLLYNNIKFADLYRFPRFVIPELTKENYFDVVNTIYDGLPDQFPALIDSIPKYDLINPFKSANENEINEAWNLFEVNKIMME